MTAADRAKEFTDSLRHRPDEEKQRELTRDWLKHVEEINGVKPLEPRTFEWPCGKRKAHGPHIIEEDTPYEKKCPGVKAHPATQIGGNYDAW